MTRKEKKEYTDDQEAENVIIACKKEIETFNNLDSATIEQATKICAKIHSK